ncbi:MAG: MmgE/PrpD family protein [Deltaproteobacteria bacterium]|nr:MmgE/PrpD family protein [Deltaproteobacteria bacterium]
MSHTREIAKFVSGLGYGDIPGEAIERAKEITLHAIAVAVAGSGVSTSQTAARLATAGGGRPEASLWCGDARVPAAEATFANGAASDVLDWEDCAWTGHASAGAIPAALAFSERQGLSGRRFLAAVVAAYEGYQRIAMALQPDVDALLGENRPWGLVSWQIFASAIAAGHALGFDEGRMAACVSAAAYATPNFRTEEGDGDLYHLAHGLCARLGADCASLTEAGFEYFDNGLDDERYWRQLSNKVDWGWIGHGLGERWLIGETLLKRWPANVWAQAPLDALDAIVRENGLAGDDITSIRVTPQVEIISADAKIPVTYMEAQYSFRYLAAMYLTGLEPSAAWFSPGKIVDESIRKRSEIVSYPTPKVSALKMFEIFWQGTFPEVTVEVETRQGGRYGRTLRHPKGHPRNRFTLGEVQGRAFDLIAPFKGEARAGAFVEAVARLEDLGDVRDWTDKLSPRGGAGR